MTDRTEVRHPPIGPRRIPFSVLFFSAWTSPWFLVAGFDSGISADAGTAGLDPRVRATDSSPECSRASNRTGSCVTHPRVPATHRPAWTSSLSSKIALDRTNDILAVSVLSCQPSPSPSRAGSRPPDEGKDNGSTPRGPAVIDHTYRPASSGRRLATEKGPPASKAGGRPSEDPRVSGQKVSRAESPIVRPFR